MTFRLVPKILYTINMIVLVRKQLTVVDTIMFKLRDIQCVIAAKGIAIHNTIWGHFLPNNRHQGLALSIGYDDSIHLAIALK